MILTPPVRPLIRAAARPTFSPGVEMESDSRSDFRDRATRVPLL